MTSHEYAHLLGNIIFSLGAKFHQNEKLFFRAATTPTKGFFLIFDKTIHQKSRVFGLGLLDVECMLLRLFAIRFKQARMCYLDGLLKHELLY
jgi:hypothetical protein